VGGVLIHGLYRDDTTWATAALRGGDLATLLIVVPTLVASLIMTMRGSARAQLVWIGMLAYTIYNYAYYVFGAAFNDLFLIHIAIFSSAIFALIFALPRMHVEDVARRFGPRTRARTVAVS
jgi:hypothetical protein